MEITIAVLLTTCNIIFILYSFYKISEKYSYEGMPLFLISVIMGMTLNISLFVLYLKLTR